MAPLLSWEEDMGCNGIHKDRTRKCLFSVGKLILIWIWIWLPAVLSPAAYAQEPPVPTGKIQQAQLEEELMKLLEEGVKSDVISGKLRDSILLFIKNNNSLSPEMFKSLDPGRLATTGDTLADDRMIVIRDGVPIVVRKNSRQDPLPGKSMREDWQKSLNSPPEASPMTSHQRNGVNTSLLLPDKLPVPEREGRDRNPALTPEQLKRKMLSLDYFSKGIDGYYQKLIAMGYVGQGWVETKEAADAIIRMRNSIDANLAPYRASTYTTPGFIRRLSSSKSPFKRLLGNLLNMLNNGAQLQIGSGYKNNNYLITTPPPPPMGNGAPQKYE